MVIMKERHLQVSLLHAVPAFFPVYESAGGYMCSTSQWSAVPVSTSQLMQSAADFLMTAHSMLLVQEASFPHDTDRLMKLHQQFSESRFSGCIVRTAEYWNEYLSVELQNSLWVLEKGGSIVSWLSICPRSGRLQLREFGIDNSSTGGVSIAMALSAMLSHASQKESIVHNAGNEPWSFVLPTLVLDQLPSEDFTPTLSFLDLSAVQHEDDLGWMYKVLDESISGDELYGPSAPHLIWPADSF